MATMRNLKCFNTVVLLRAALRGQQVTQDVGSRLPPATLTFGYARAAGPNP